MNSHISITEYTSYRLLDLVNSILHLENAGNQCREEMGTAFHGFSRKSIDALIEKLRVLKVESEVKEARSMKRRRNAFLRKCILVVGFIALIALREDLWKTWQMLLGIILDRLVVSSYTLPTP